MAVVSILLVSSLTIIGVTAQVNKEIDQFEDLLAVDSFNNEIIVARPSFSKAQSKKFSKFGGSNFNQISSRDRFAKPSRGARVQQSRLFNDGSYSFRYITDDGMTREEKGQPDGQGVTGSWSYTGQDGRQYQMNFVADQFGYRPDSSNLHIAHRMAFKQAEMLARRSRQLGGRRARGGARNRP